MLFVNIFSKILSTVSSLKGGRPTKYSYIITPMLHQSSEGLLEEMPLIISGAI
jgi:hypothetical protein